MLACASNDLKRRSPSTLRRLGCTRCGAVTNSHRCDSQHPRFVYAISADILILGRGEGVGEQAGHVPPLERRRAPRFRVEVPMEYNDHSLAGSGYTANISASGVRIDRASQRVPIGVQLGLRFSFFLGSFEIQFTGEVVRHTEDGFAVQFGILDPAQLNTLRTALPSVAYS